MLAILVAALVPYTTLGAIIPQAVINADTESFFQFYNPTSESKLLTEDKDYWYDVAEDYLNKNLKYHNEPKLEVAKNVIIFIGDGMGIQSVTATRIYKGQRQYGKSGEDHNLVYDKFPNVALAKTYNVDMQVPDSAGTATAIFTGVKTRMKSIGVDVQSNRTFDKKIYETSKLPSIMTWAQEANKDTGIITTTRITHATPAGTYAHVNHRDWECDDKIPDEYKNQIKDIARQLVEDAPGKNFKVIMGGGYQEMGYTFRDAGGNCIRKDGRNLTQVWLDSHKGSNAAFVTNTEGLQSINPNTDYLLGLFHADHLPYELKRDKSPKGSPSLTEMTRAGLKILKKNPNGFVLMVEGGRIDHGHHENKARLALQESSELDNAIKLAVDESASDTLIIVTADHSHSLTINGYPRRGSDILGYMNKDPDEKKHYPTLSYANGPGFEYHYTPNDTTSELYPWREIKNDPNRLNDVDYRNMAALQLDDETHGGEDVGVFAMGPSSHYIRGVIEQNYIAHIISYAACIGPRASLNNECIKGKSLNSSNNLYPPYYIIYFYVIYQIFIIYFN